LIVKVNSAENGVSAETRVETVSRQITPKHQGRPAIIRDQRTRPVNNIHTLTKSAKPPSPVQIRAAPPVLKKDACFVATQSRARKGPQVSLADAVQAFVTICESRGSGCRR
jgi:hypothetical protein